MSSESQLSVALQAHDDHWTWALIDIRGATVASGSAPERAAAERQLWTAYRVESGASRADEAHFQRLSSRPAARPDRQRPELTDPQLERRPTRRRIR
jgi:hypothetical protein